MAGCLALTQLPRSLTNLTSISRARHGLHIHALAFLPHDSSETAMSTDHQICRCPAGISELELISCARLEALPPEIGAMTALTSLDCQGCAALRLLPASVTQVPS